ncbi:hypothetical protein E5C26_01655 [Serratia proteamaculans]|uniref:winged helix-turn-helix domain-containing protein n=1 Tax=Serratia proteamaculans TaxID=28151 RepID=UPI001076371D|nr:winged helix-turn-helix domain-containing protein [Serratia proteamaculans]TFZ53061.1 hypothetical protein E5C26_01655 [Serratia proteamaculans]
MNQVHIINGVLLFDILMSRLQPYPLPENDVNHYSLNTPVSRCLQLLIERHGEIVSQEEFFDYVWKQHGLVVSSNSFYQNISLLRKAIKKAGIDDDLIVTVPKKGIVLPKRFTIEPLNKNNTIQSNFQDPPTKSKGSKTLLSSALVLTSIIFFVIAFNINKENDYALEYRKVDIKKDGCTFFFNNDENDYSSHEVFLQSKSFDCSLNKYIYLKKYQKIDRVSLIQCMKKMESNIEKNFCISEYYAQRSLDEKP